jgi:hypothetical protein
MSPPLLLALLLVPLVAGVPTDLYGKQATIDYDHGKVVNDYSPEQPRCTMVDKVEYKDVCEPYTEMTCVTQNEEDCNRVSFNTCTGVIESKQDRRCFDVTELVCGLKEQVQFNTIVEEFQVQLCTIMKERVCDTTYVIGHETKDDLQCTDLETTVCQDKIVTIQDVTCKDTFDFDCKKKKAAELGMEGYGMFTTCEKIPRKRCYETPRQVRTEVCQPDKSRFCQKVTNEHPTLVQRQNCHFEPKKVCELQKRTRNKKAKRFSYSQDCKPVARNICDTCEVKEVVPRCEQESRLVCTYKPEEKCSKRTEQYCYKQEVKTQEEVCDDKFVTYQL